jgi:hypothetical protein
MIAGGRLSGGDDGAKVRSKESATNAEVTKRRGKEKRRKRGD